MRKGKETVATLGPGDVAGDVTLVTAGLRTAAVVSTSELEVLHIDAWHIRQLIEERPKLSAGVGSLPHVLITRQVSRIPNAAHDFLSLSSP